MLVGLHLLQQAALSPHHQAIVALSHFGLYSEVRGIGSIAILFASQSPGILSDLHEVTYGPTTRLLASCKSCGRTACLLPLPSVRYVFQVRRMQKVGALLLLVGAILGALVLPFTNLGQPTVPGVLMDAQAARRKLEELANCPTSDIVIIGESIGGAVAVELAAEEAPRGLILQSTFSNLKDLAGIHYPQYVSFVPNDILNSTNLIQKYHGPLLQSHGENDRIIPITLGRSLFELAVGEKQFLAIPEARHNDWQTPAYFIQLDDFLRQFAASSPE